ncbi:allatostatin-A receptor [Lingula anatina]|uniref:Allatostatin-A receptor n=1 Tax=Lingula anatina TaxID=7574 RepID=A0A1S3JNK4_LINAN|nr:allatostatin-A receptor [Lingula anatina]XP_013411951.1 allatostatin-A receptor [Lingula anatina]|eukprot:XP_013411950.1 allatostatin-A receptor [Lingula anatina]
MSDPVNLTYVTNVTINGSSGDTTETGQNDPETTLQIVTAAVLVIVTVVGIFGNSLVLLVIFTESSMRTVANILFFNLALSDLMFVIVCCPVLLLDLFGVQLPTFVCKTGFYLLYSTVAVSIYSIVAICLFRCLATSNPLKSASILTKKNATLTSGAIWVFALSINIPYAVYFKSYDDGGCTDDVPEFPEGFFEGLAIFKFVMNFALPSFAIVVLSVLIVVVMRRHDRLRAAARKNGSYSEGSIAETKKVVFVVAVVVLVFEICWAPSNIWSLLRNMGVEIKAPPELFRVFTLLSFSNSAVNPIIYNFASADFRREFRRIFYRCLCKKKIGKLGTAGNTNLYSSTDSTFVNNADKRKSDNEGVESHPLVVHKQNSDSQKI